MGSLLPTDDPEAALHWDAENGERGPVYRKLTSWFDGMEDLLWTPDDGRAT